MPAPDTQQVAVGLLVDAGRVLLGLRASGRPYGGLWALPGAHIEPGESARVALVRELEEELGVYADLPDTEPITTSVIAPALGLAGEKLGGHGVESCARGTRPAGLV